MDRIYSKRGRKNLQKLLDEDILQRGTGDLTTQTHPAFVGKLFLHQGREGPPQFSPRQASVCLLFYLRKAGWLVFLAGVLFSPTFFVDLMGTAEGE